MEKDILKQILIESFKHFTLKNIDDKILDFLLMKTFQGSPLLVNELFNY